MTVRTDQTTLVDASSVKDDKVCSKRAALDGNFITLGPATSRDESDVEHMEDKPSVQSSMHGIIGYQPDYSAVDGGVSLVNPLEKMVGHSSPSSSSVDTFAHFDSWPAPACLKHQENGLLQSVCNDTVSTAGNTIFRSLELASGSCRLTKCMSQEGFMAKGIDWKRNPQQD